MPGGADWFSRLSILVILLVLVGLLVYALSNRPPSESRIRLPSLSHSNAPVESVEK